MPEFNFNRIYKPVFTSSCRYIDVWGGRGRGGSHFGTDRFLFKITQPRYFRGYFIRQKFNDIRDSLFRDIKDRIAENTTLRLEDFKINENNLSITYLPTGNMILSKGASGDSKRTAKLKSIAGATDVLIEEADELSQEEFDQLDLSLRTTKAEKIEVVRIFNPPGKDHWIWQDYNLTESPIKGYYQATPKTNSNVLSVFSTYEDNLINIDESTRSKFEKFKETNPEYYYTIIKGLISEGARGRIYSGWQTISDEDFDKIDLPCVYGLDFGFSNDPTAIVKVKYGKGVRYYKEVLYQTGLTNSMLAMRMRDLGITNQDCIIADSAAPSIISELRYNDWQIEGYPNLSFSIYPALKIPGSINVGINKVKENEVYMTESSTNGWHEYREYKWRLDIEKKATDTPMDKFNHLMDPIRYVELNKGHDF